MTTETSQFIYLTSKRESSPLLKAEMAERFPEFRFSYSRPGFQTYRLPAETDFRKLLRKDFSVSTARLTFASSMSMALGKIRGGTPDEMPRAFREFLETHLSQEGTILDGFPVPTRVHFWRPASPEPTSDTERITAQLETFLHVPESVSASRFLPPRPGEICLDCAALSETEWWIGFHAVSDYHSRFPGGYVPLVIPSDGTSRAWMKFEEGLRWSGFPIGCGSRCADIGASPGGGSQALLARGAEVLGVDPAEMADTVLLNPDFTHLRGRIGQLKRKLFRKTRWLIADMNVAPNYTLDVLEELTAAPDIEIRGLLFTMKFFQLELAKQIPEYLARIRSWGFNRIKIRQLTFNRQEVMTAALKHPFRPNR